MRFPGARTLASAALIILLAGPLAALVEPSHPTRIVPLEIPGPRVETEAATTLRGIHAWQAFQLETRAKWRLEVDARTGRPALLSGGTPLVPGPANELGRDPRWREAMSEAPDAFVEQQARAFLQRHAALFRVDPADLHLDPGSSGSVLDGLVRFLSYEYRPHGIPVEGGAVVLRINRGNLVQAGSTRILDREGLDPIAAVPAEQAVERARSILGGGRPVQGEPKLVWVPRADGRGGLRYDLAWRFRLERAGDIATWQAHVDAHTGEVIGLEDANRYLCSPDALAWGRVTGGVRPMQWDDPEEVRPLGRIAVASQFADDMGLWLHPGGNLSAFLAGEVGAVRCIGCENPKQPSTSVAPTGEIEFGTGGDNQIGNGRSTLAGRTTYYHVARSARMGTTWLGPISYFRDPGFLMNVNINAACNAFYSGSAINMFRKAGNCNNMGEIPGVISHEWGHGLDAATGFGTGGRSEGLADHVAWLQSHDPRIGPWFRTDGRPVRNVDEDVVGVRSYPNGCGNSPHCRGTWWGQAGWHFTRTLRQQFGEHTGFRLYEQLFFAHLFGSNTLDPDSPTGTYEAMAVVLDDNGDLSDGIYFGTWFNEAFDHHGLAPASPYGDAGLPCDPFPDAVVPDLQLRAGSETGRAEAVLSWDPVPGVASYQVLRNQLGDRENLILLATVAAAETSYVDPGLVQGDTYHYVVLPVIDESEPFCMAQIGALASITVDLVQVGLDSVALEGPGGSDGVWLPGETIQIRPTLRDLSPTSGATAVTTSLFQDDFEVTVNDDFADVGDLAAGEVAPAGDTWEVSLVDDSFLCGRTFTFLASIEAEEGCWDGSFDLTAGAGAASVVLDGYEIDDSGPEANGNGVAEPGERVSFRPLLRNRGPQTARNVELGLQIFDPRLSATPDTIYYGDIGVDQTVTPAGAFLLDLTGGLGCEDLPTLFLDVSASNGCWRDQIRLPLVKVDALVREDFEEPAGGWAVSGGAADGAWVQTNPIDTGPQPGDDTTPSPGILAFVTGNAVGAPEDGDVDDGCTVLTSPVWDLGAAPGLSLTYQRFYHLSGATDDELLVEISNDGGGVWRELETISASTGGWRAPTTPFELDAVLGEPADRLRFRVTACDQGTESLVEAGLDDLVIATRFCEEPDPRPELRPIQWAVDDGITTGSGDADGILEPGETAEIRILLANGRDEGATSIAGTLSLEGAVAGVTLLDDQGSWADIGAGGVGQSVAPSFLLEVADTAACGERIPLRLDVDYLEAEYAGGSPRGFTAEARHVFDVGVFEPGGGPEETLFQDAADGGSSPWIHADVHGLDDWQRKEPLGLEGDPDAAFSPPNAWGNELGGMAQGNPVGGAYSNDSLNFLESLPIDLSGHAAARLRFQRWLTLAAGDAARVLVGDEVVWEAPPEGLSETAWSAQDLDVSAAADGRSRATIRFELESDASGTAGGWTLDDIELAAVPVEPICSAGTCDDGDPPEPAGSVLRVRGFDRLGLEAGLDWDGYRGRALQFNVYRADGDPTALSLDLSSVPGRGAAVDAAEPLVFWRVRAVNPCGIEEE